jgi:hypothetical protein
VFGTSTAEVLRSAAELMEAMQVATGTGPQGAEEAAAVLREIADEGEEAVLLGNG